MGRKAEEEERKARLKFQAEQILTCYLTDAEERKIIADAQKRSEAEAARSTSSSSRCEAAEKVKLNLTKCGSTPAPQTAMANCASVLSSRIPTSVLSPARSGTSSPTSMAATSMTPPRSV